jgi:hypothetical protein
MKVNAVKLKKKEFALRYAGKNPAALGRLAAAQRANLYTPNLDHSCVYPYWEALLDEYASRYQSNRREEDFILDCEEIKKKMNDRFSDYFKNNKVAEGYESGFRFAHAQKSLSITLKHLWCREELSSNEPKYYPPVCPIDGKILKKVGCYDSWTKVNYVNRTDITPNNTPVYQDHLRLIKDYARQNGFDSLAEWELFVWPGNSSVTVPANITTPPVQTSNRTQDSHKTVISSIHPNIRIRRDVDFGYKLELNGDGYYLFIGHKPTFHYCELLTQKIGKPINTFPKLQLLRDNGFNKEGIDYIYKKLRNPYDETQASDYLEFIKDLLV